MGGELDPALLPSSCGRRCERGCAPASIARSGGRGGRKQLGTGVQTQPGRRRRRGVLQTDTSRTLREPLRLGPGVVGTQLLHVLRGRRELGKRPREALRPTPCRCCVGGVVRLADATSTCLWGKLPVELLAGVGVRLVLMWLVVHHHRTEPSVLGEGCRCVSIGR